jgi:hypothetical protein
MSGRAGVSETVILPGGFPLRISIEVPGNNSLYHPVFEVTLSK